jgi:hypothetical protein
MHSHSIRNPTCFDAICIMFRGSQPNTKQYRKCDYARYTKCILLDDKDSIRCWQFHSKYESYITWTSENMVSLYVISRRHYEQRQLKRLLLIVNGRGLERRQVSTGPRGWKTGQLVFEPAAPKQNFSLGVLIATPSCERQNPLAYVMLHLAYRYNESLRTGRYRVPTRAGKIFSPFHTRPLYSGYRYRFSSPPRKRPRRAVNNPPHPAPRLNMSRHSFTPPLCYHW